MILKIKNLLVKLHSLALYTLEPARFREDTDVAKLWIIVTSVTKSDKALAYDVKNLGNMFQRPSFKTVHQVLLPENAEFDRGDLDKCSHVDEDNDADEMDEGYDVWKKTSPTFIQNMSLFDACWEYIQYSDGVGLGTTGRIMMEWIDDRYGDDEEDGRCSKYQRSEYQRS